MAAHCRKAQQASRGIRACIARAERVATTIDIDRLTEAELIGLSYRIVARLKFLQQMRAHAHMPD